jgi:MFS family permease
MMPRTDRFRLVNAMLGQFITGFAGRSFGVGLPTVANTLHADILGTSWAIIAYQLAGISSSVVFGRLGDIHRRYAIYGTGFAIMAASAFSCGMAPSIVWEHKRHEAPFSAVAAPQCVTGRPCSPQVH